MPIWGSDEEAAAAIGAQSTVRAARLAAGAAVLAAVATVLSALWAANVTNQGETERSRSEFLRGQQQALYAKIIKHQMATDKAMNEMLQYTEDGVNDPRFLKPSIAFRTDSGLLIDDGYEVKVLSTNRTVTALTALSQSEYDLFQQASSVAALCGGGRTDKRCAGMVRQLNADVVTVEDNYNELVASFRKDLGAKD